MYKINTNFLLRVKTKIFDNNDLYLKMKLDISKIFFGFTSSLYFFIYLSILAWFNTEPTTKILAWILPVFLFSIFVLLYDLIMYWLKLTRNKALMVKIPLIIVFGIIFALTLAIFYGFKINK